MSNAILRSSYLKIYVKYNGLKVVGNVDRTFQAVSSNLAYVKKERKIEERLEIWFTKFDSEGEEK